MLCYLCVEAVVQHSSHTPPKGLQLWNFCKVDILVGNLCNICCILPHHLKKIWENMRKYEKVRKFVYVGKIPYFRQVLLNSRLHSSLVTLAETFSIPRTDFRRFDGSRKMRRENPEIRRTCWNHKHLFYFPTFPVTFTHFQGKHFRSYLNK